MLEWPSMQGFKGHEDVAFGNVIFASAEGMVGFHDLRDLLQA